MRDDGFTLVEVLVALAVFSLAALALLRLQGATLSGAARIDGRTMAAIVAQNIAIDALTAQPAPAFGASSGKEVNGGRTWGWTRTVTRLPDVRLQRIDVRVTAPGDGILATLTVVRRVA